MGRCRYLDCFAALAMRAGRKERYCKRVMRNPPNTDSARHCDERSEEAIQLTFAGPCPIASLHDCWAAQRLDGSPRDSLAPGRAAHDHAGWRACARRRGTLVGPKAAVDFPVRAASTSATMCARRSSLASLARRSRPKITLSVALFDR